jgi:hypothetical protein
MGVLLRISFFFLLVAGIWPTSLAAQSAIDSLSASPMSTPDPITRSLYQTWQPRGKGLLGDRAGMPNFMQSPSVIANPSAFRVTFASSAISLNLRNRPRITPMDKAGLILGSGMQTAAFAMVAVQGWQDGSKTRTIAGAAAAFIGAYQVSKNVRIEVK